MNNPISTVLGISDDDEDDDIGTQSMTSFGSTSLDLPRIIKVPEDAEKAREENFELAKQNVKDMMPSIAEGITDMLQTAKVMSSSEHATAAASLARLYLAAQKTLTDIEKTHAQVKGGNQTVAEGPSPASGGSTTNIVMAGTTADLQKMLKDMRNGKVAEAE